MDGTRYKKLTEVCFYEAYCPKCDEVNFYTGEDPSKKLGLCSCGRVNDVARTNRDRWDSFYVDTELNEYVTLEEIQKRGAEEGDGTGSQIFVGKVQ